jgi:hypothetical protein
MEVLISQELVKAHNDLARAIVKASVGIGFTTETDRVADLMERYKQLVIAK